jgi:hypothetical protein
MKEIKIYPWFTTAFLPAVLNQAGGGKTQSFDWARSAARSERQTSVSENRAR